MTALGTTGRFASRTSKNGADTRTVHERVADLRAQIDGLMDSERKAAIGDRLKRAREDSPYTQKRAAQRASVELRTWQAWETGRGVNRPNIERAAGALGVTADSIWNDPPPSIDAERFARLEAKVDWLVEQAGGDPVSLATALESGAAAEAGMSGREPDEPERGTGAK